MATLLLIVIYAAYIALGIPDSLFGTAWPVMHLEFGLSVDVAGYITPLFSLFSIISSAASAKIINRFGTGKVAAVSTALTVVGLFGYSVSHNIFAVIFFAIPLGFGAGAIDVGMNTYVALHYKAMHMSFLHCFYGVGVSLSPFFMSKALEKYGVWQVGYRNAGIIQLVICVIMILTLPLWSTVRHTYSGGGEEKPSRNVGLRELSRDSSVRNVWLCFFTSCSIEYLCGTWGSTFLVECKNLSADRAALMIAFYYAGLALGRFLSGVLSIRLSSWRIIFLGLGTLIPAIVLVLLPLPAVFACAGLFLIGLGNGPMYPNLVHLTPSCFGEDIAQSVISSQMAAAYVSFMVMPFIYGGIVKLFGLASFPVYAAVLYMLFAFAVLNLAAKKRKESEKYERGIM